MIYIYGIGRSSTARILGTAGVDHNIRVQDWANNQATAIREQAFNGYEVKDDLRNEEQLNIKRLMDIGCYRGVRYRIGLPLRGQGTKSSTRARKGGCKTVTGKKKATK